MWFDNGQFNTIAYPLDQLPSIAEKRSLTGSLSESELLRRQEASELLLDELRSAPQDPPEGSGHVDQQVDDDTIETVDWDGVITRGDFESIRSADEWWRVDLAEILDDLLFYWDA